MSKHSIRIWNHVEVKEITSKLLLIEDLYGICGSCKQVGLNYLKDTTCPGCKTEFKYLATRLTAEGEINKILSRIQKENLPYTLIDREDYDRAMSRDKVGDLFG